MMFVFPVSCKSAIPRNLSGFFTYIAVPSDVKLKAFQSDNESEFYNAVLQQHMKDNGVLHEVNVPGKSSQNGLLERRCGLLKSTMETLLFIAKVNHYF